MSDKKFILIVFSVIFLAISLILGLSDFSWFFNKRYVSYAFEEESLKSTPEASNIANSIEIEKIKINAPIIIPDGADSTLKSELDQGVVYFPGSALPGENGQAVLLGHSAPANWPKIKYDWVFNDLNKLEPGDQITIHFNNKEYVYKVTKNYIINKGEELSNKDNSKKILVLMSCWPPGKDYKRMAVEAEIIN